jgi:hypothetical protein
MSFGDNCGRFFLPDIQFSLSDSSLLAGHFHAHLNPFGWVLAELFSDKNNVLVKLSGFLGDQSYSGFSTQTVLCAFHARVSKLRCRYQLLSPEHSEVQ